jgi:mannose-1-phosphate guanylyltransferase/mannose-6-phosphate isomerase
MQALCPVILSGGSGTRLWPLSREQYPKQLLPLLGTETLLQATVKRLDGLQDIVIQPPVIVCNQDYRFLTAEQLRQIERTADALILEPKGRNTAPALTLAALHLEASDPVMVVMPADHLVKDADAFRAAIATAVEQAAQGAVVAFGIVPDRPETGYGYIKAGQPLAGSAAARHLEAFVEKPDLARARTYVESGDYSWNSGIFVIKASVWITLIGRFRADILAACRMALRGSAITQDRFLAVDTAAFTDCPADSIDYAVMERIAGGAQADVPALIVPMNAGWSDVGAWDALWEVAPKDEHGNVCRGDTMLHDVRNSLVMSEGRLIACVGIEDMVVIDTPDAVMIAHRDHAQDVKHIAARLKQAKRSEASIHRKVYRPWGYYDSVDHGERFQVKRIVVNPGAAISMQMHHHRAEHWIVVRGTARVTRGEEVIIVSENQSTYIPLGTHHRLENPGRIPLEIIEVQSGTYLGEDDIVRFEDIYGRS